MQNWLQVANNDISITEFPHDVPHYKPYYTRPNSHCSESTGQKTCKCQFCAVYLHPVAFLALKSTTVIMLVLSYREKVLTNLLHHHRLGMYVASSCIYGIARALQYIQSLSFCSTFRHSTIIAVLFGLEQDLSSSHLVSYCQLTSASQCLLRRWCHLTLRCQMAWAPRYGTTDHWIQESIKRIFSSGLFWAVGAA